MFGRSVTQKEVKSVKDFSAILNHYLTACRADKRVAGLFGLKNEELAPAVDAARFCTHCNGTGRASYNPGQSPGQSCYACVGKGVFTAPDFQAIFEAVTSNRGAQKDHRVFRKSAPSDVRERRGGSLGARSYFVWRIARFDGGADVTMTMEASFCVEGDPYKSELQVMADVIALAVFGTVLGGAARWGAAMGKITYEDAARITGGLCTSQSCGPVHDGNKPEEELMELIG